MTSLMDENGVWITDCELIKKMAFEYFRNLYQDVGAITDPTHFLNFDRGSRLSEAQLLSIL